MGLGRSVATSAGIFRSNNPSRGHQRAGVKTFFLIKQQKKIFERKFLARGASAPIGTGFGTFYIIYESSAILDGPGVLAFEYDHLGHHAPGPLVHSTWAFQRPRANGYNFAPRYPSHINEHRFGFERIFHTQ